MLAYLRLFLVCIWLVVSCLISYVAVILPIRNKDINAIFSKIFAWGTFRILKIRIEVEGAERLDPSRPCVFVGNHQSGLDLPLFGQLIARGTLAVGKHELIWIPFFGPLFFLAGNITIRRQKHQHALAGLFEGVKAIRTRHVSIFIFPEGTRNRSGKPLLPFKKGGFYMALKSGVPVVPMVSSPMGHLLDLKSGRLGGGVVKIRVLPPVITRGRSEKELSQLVEEVRGQMLEAVLSLATETRP